MALPERRNRQTAPASFPFDWDPFSELNRINRELTEWLGQSGRPFGGDAFVPPADVEETDGEYLVEVELPGIKRQDIDVELIGRRLTIHGERNERERVGILRHKTRRVGQFLYEVLLPGEVAEEDVGASFADGVLTVRIAKAETEKPKKITVS